MKKLTYLLFLLPSLSFADLIDEACGDVTVSTLFAGQNIDVGTVTVFNTENEIVVIYDTDAPWQLTEYHLAVEGALADIPQTKKGNPKNGHFEFGGKLDASTNEIVQVISITDQSAGDPLIVAAHAVVRGNGEETAWADGAEFGGKNWATYISTSVQQCQTIIVDPPVTGCVWSQDYWFTRSAFGTSERDPAWDAFPELELFMMGPFTNFEIISQFSFNDAYLILAREYLIAELNQANGASQPIVVQDAVAGAALWFNTNMPNVDFNSPEGQEALAYYNTLSLYNNGLLAPFACFDDED